MEGRHSQRAVLAASVACAALAFVCRHAGADPSGAAPDAKAAAAPGRANRPRAKPVRRAEPSAVKPVGSLSPEALLASLSWCAAGTSESDKSGLGSWRLEPLAGPPLKPGCPAPSPERPWNRWESAPTQEQATPGRAAFVDLQPPAAKSVRMDSDLLAGQPPATPHWTIRLHTDFHF
jgi:hypothetical protein